MSKPTAKIDHTLPAVPTQLLLAGKWAHSSGGRRFDVHNPATGEVLATIADANEADGVAALDAAVEAAAAWAATAPRKRGEILRRAFDLLQQRRADFARVMTLEMGKPLAEADGEVTYGGEFLRWFGEEAARITGRYGSNPEGSGTMVVSHAPVGPCFLITPWNFPLAMATRKIAPAIAAGCTMVVKPAALTPLTTNLFAQLLLDAGLPPGVLNVLTTTDSHRVSAKIIGDPRLRKLSFTGSTEVGRKLIAQAGENILRTSMELGGNAPFVVFADADIAAAVDGAMIAKFRNIGQACTAANRFVVAQSIANDFAARLLTKIEKLEVGDGLVPGVTIGPLIDDKAVKKVDELVRDAITRGATLRTGGKPIEGAGTFYPPTLLTDVPGDARLLREEIFGPVIAIVTFADDDEDEAVRLANDTEYGLVSYVYTQDLRRGQRMIARLETGMMGLNTGVVSNAAAPFGGVKQSGVGREGGHEGIAEYLTTKYTLVAP